MQDKRSKEAKEVGKKVVAIITQSKDKLIEYWRSVGLPEKEIKKRLRSLGM